MVPTQARCLLVAIVAAVGLAACGGGSTTTSTTPPPSTPPASGPTSASGTTGTSTSTGSSGATGSSAAALAADTAAQQLARTAGQAALSYANANNGSYAGLTPAGLQTANAAIQIGPGNGDPYIDSSTGVVVLSGGAGYAVTATSTTGDSFSVGASSSGQATQTCIGSASAACQAGSWSAVGASGGTAAPRAS